LPRLFKRWKHSAWLRSRHCGSMIECIIRDSAGVNIVSSKRINRKCEV
jgi:hypothetical protein